MMQILCKKYEHLMLRPDILLINKKYEGGTYEKK